MKKLTLLLISGLFVIACKTEKKEKIVISKGLTAEEKIDSAQIKHIFNTALTEGKSYEWLRDLTQNIGSRLSGSEGAAKSVVWSEQLMKDVGLDSVWLQPVMVPHWVRGEKEVANYTFNGQEVNVPICALGGSIATPDNGITAEVIQVKSIEEAKKLGDKAKGKIVFFNGAFDNTHIQTFKAYGGCVGQRYGGASIVGKFGAKGVIVRSMTNGIDDYPHTGSMGYGDIPESEYIPAAAISSRAAENLSKHLKENPNIKFYFKQSCKTLPDAPSHNVVGEIKGSENPDKIMVIGGHLDSWDLGEGAHDDGTGVVQSLEVAYLLKKNNIKPKNTIRIVFFMNEENGLRGATEYARLAKQNNEIHIGALESDAGGHTPRGFSIDANEKNRKLLQSWKKLLAPYGLHDLTQGGSGADIGPLKDDHVTLVGYRPDSQRYFDYHHAATDTFDKVNKRELELGSASMTSIVYLMDKYLYNNETLKP
ncbi:MULTISPECIES: M20/M25/M40 family metallo-hydrolase [unclassified Tenacibaculum]|uniref:M20/M25/M40 family metallo-hydrolase n=1 Tax=unclassified Tenacibaculum TaxID=2635139 RepID=UPI001F1EDC05|nr:MULTISPECIES: M20/M25/M40 family metallo-hydrolase [unclassified Tenacibaculum]MCF2873472.1 M20/M25/M40 family metallo-hydrolase [Tenacibaculum sp. Cn5-1]MCF2933628.1 M20/M25/M40 family metallo-hydrolase [Tenacibaculum sp. Cn5-34]MCG7509790.1 M20/M25/M40 family metallo-hydrolase [Tenacibaculum sp. Cn5-46]